MNNFASIVVAKALAEVGYYEKSTNEMLEGKTENKGTKNWNKYAAFIDENFPDFYNGKKNGYDWCDIFVDYLFLSCFGIDNALHLLCQPVKSGGAGCTVSRSYYKAKGQYNKIPKVGSQIFFTKDGGKSCYHTGIVTKIVGSIVYTVEGNSGNMVAERKYDINNKIIDGYGHPNYDKVVQTMKSDVDIAKEVIAGKWGTGAERKNRLTAAGYNPDTVQGIVNALLSGPNDTPSEHENGTLVVDVDKSKYTQVIINIK